MTLRLHIDGAWSAAEFAAFFQCLDQLHNHLALHVQYSFVRPGQVYAFGPRNPPPDSRFVLNVASIEYSSPGHTDLLGIAGVLRELREFIQWLVERWGDQGLRRAAEQKQILENQLLKIEASERLLAILDKYGTEMPVQADRHFGIKRNEPPSIDPILEAVIEARLVGTQLSDKRKEIE